MHVPGLQILLFAIKIIIIYFIFWFSRHESEISRPSKIEIDRDEAIQEVQRLPDIVRKDPGASSEGGGVGGRLMQGRKERCVVSE